MVSLFKETFHVALMNNRIKLINSCFNDSFEFRQLAFNLLDLSNGLGYLNRYVSVLHTNGRHSKTFEGLSVLLSEAASGSFGKNVT